MRGTGRGAHRSGDRPGRGPARRRRPGLIVGFFAVAAGDIEVGAATTAALYFHGLFNPIGGLLSQLDTVQDAGASLARLVGVLRLDRAVDSPSGTPATGCGCGTSATTTKPVTRCCGGCHCRCRRRAAWCWSARAGPARPPWSSWSPGCCNPAKGWSRWVRGRRAP
ncbi:protein of unknown function [Micropruina glycogenica]|uniref:Uncharacterized protein n=1 Tax=Micropruina glycogenica TaxID=75385 RepID=A0A2N9JEV1_9ACTN|nr:protein of unknown function [Micropruina glycogenica]